MRPELPVLIKARALIADPAKWGKGMRGGGELRPLGTCCAAEAIEDVAGNPKDSWRPTRRDIELRKAAYESLSRSFGGGSIIDWNDAPERIHADILAAFDKAIASAS